MADVPEHDDDVVYTYHRPISITVTKVGFMPAVRDLPQETLMVANLKLGIDVQKKMLEILKNNLEKENPRKLIALTIKGVS